VLGEYPQYPIDSGLRQYSKLSFLMPLRIELRLIRGKGPLARKGRMAISDQVKPLDSFTTALRKVGITKNHIEILAGSALILEGMALLWFRRSLPLAVQVILWGQIVLTFAGLKSFGLFRLFGPVLFYDLVRSARRNRTFLTRILYAIFLGLVLTWVYFVWLAHNGNWDQVRAKDMPEFAATFFYTFMIVQLGLVVLLTPAYTAGAIAEEKDRKTLEFILATDLHSREIVLSKLVSRLLNITLIVLTGLPILSFMQLLGGVDPQLLLAGFAATGLTMVGLGGLSILNSVIARRARDAIVLTYLEAVGYILLSGMSWLLLVPSGWAVFPSTMDWTSPVTLQDVVEIFNSGNLAALVLRLWAELIRAGRLDLLLPDLLRDYAIFHLGLALINGIVAVVRLRSSAIAHGESKPLVRQSSRSSHQRPAVGDEPILWKELYVERGPRLHWLGRILIALLVAASFLPIGFIFYHQVFESNRIRGNWLVAGWGSRSSWEEMAIHMNVWVRLVGSLVGTLLLLNVAVRSASSISGEREKKTFDDLLTSPLSSDAILYGKWLGCVLSVRWGWVWLGLIWGLGVLTGGLNLFCAILLVAAWFIYASLAACLGLFFSMKAKSSMRSILWTLFTAATLSFGHWLIWLLCIPMIGGGWDNELMEYIAKFQMGITPPLALGICLPYSGVMVDRFFMNALVSGIIGMIIWGVAALWFFNSLQTRFRELTGRDARMKNEAPSIGPTG
jgi:ABC-type transport system involved in multi-copper enzyme maturation permease subunit